MADSTENQLNNRHEKFALALFRGMSQKDAALEAGYKESRAYETASRLVRNGKILDRILELQHKAESDAVMSVRERKERLSEIARARIIDFVEAGADGSWINIGLESANSAALQGVTSRTEYDDDGDHPTVITKIRLHDPIKAIAELNKMEGTYAPLRMEHGGEGGKPIEVNIDAKGKLLSTINRLAARAGETEGDTKSEPERS